MSTNKFPTVAEAADLARVPPKTVAHWIYGGQLPAKVRGRHRLVRESALIAFLEGGDVRAVAGGAMKKVPPHQEVLFHINCRASQ